MGGVTSHACTTEWLAWLITINQIFQTSSLNTFECSQLKELIVSEVRVSELPWFDHYILHMCIFKCHVVSHNINVKIFQEFLIP